MAVVLVVLAGFLFSISVFILLQGSLIRTLIGLSLLSNAVNLYVFALGRPVRNAPPLIDLDKKIIIEPYANPLPQAMILTAIVISFGMLIFALVLAYRAYSDNGLLEVDEILEKSHKGEDS